MDNKMDYKRILSIGGAFIAFLIGSGFATGQEILQYFTSYGYLGIAGAFVTLILFLYVGVSFITVGFEQKFEKGNDIYKYYCGEKIGTFFDYFSILFMYLTFTVMVAGAGATFFQQFGLPTYVGGITIVTLATITVLFGLNNIVDIIGKIGPIIVIISIALGGVTLFRNLDGLAIAPQVLPTLNLTHASNNWFMAAGSYVGFSMLMLAGFLSSIGATTKSKKEGAYGAMIGAIGFSTAIIIVALGLMSCAGDIAGSLIPSLVLAKNISPLLATAFSGIIIAGIYTTAVPLLWSVSARFTEDKSHKFRVLTFILAAIGLVIGLWLPFDKLVNVVYVVNGNIGFVLLLLMVIKSIRVRMASAEVEVEFEPEMEFETELAS